MSLPAGCSAPGPLLGRRKGPRSRAARAVGTPAFPNRSGSEDAAAAASGFTVWEASGVASSRHSQGGVCVGVFGEGGRGAGSLPARVNKHPSNP